MLQTSPYTILTFICLCALNVSYTQEGSEIQPEKKYNSNDEAGCVRP